MNKEFIFTYDNSEVETITAEFKTDKLITCPFNKLYPMTPEAHNTILSGFGLELIYEESFKIGVSTVTLRFDAEHRTVIAFFNDGKAIKKPSIKNLMIKLRTMDFKIGLIIVPEASKGCDNVVRMTSSAWKRSYGLIKIKQLMTPKTASTIPSLLGRYANKSMGDPSEAKQTIVISVPSKGFPSIGKSGKLNAGDIYEILEKKTQPSGNAEKEKGFDLILESFYDMLDLIQDGKNITATRWNSILHKHGVIKFVENMEEE